MTIMRFQCVDVTGVALTEVSYLVALLHELMSMSTPSFISDEVSSWESPGLTLSG